MTPKVMKVCMIAATAFTIIVAAVAAARSDDKSLTVEQALNVAAGLAQLTKFDAVDRDGKPTVGYYKFGSDVRMAIAVNIDLGRNLQSRVQSATNDLIMQLSAGTGKIPDDKETLFRIESAKLFQTPSRVGYVRIKLGDLKLDENPIPGPVLSLIIPIVDR